MKQSPAPVVSTGVTRKDGMNNGSAPGDSHSAPSAPRVTIVSLGSIPPRAVRSAAASPAFITSMDTSGSMARTASI
jgi:hypothetical protein